MNKNKMLPITRVFYFVFLLSAFGLTFWAKAQHSYPLIRSEYYPNDQSAEEEAAAVIQNGNGLTYIGFSGGVFEFDGRERNFVATSSPVRAMAEDPQTQKVYVAGDNFFGFISRKADGRLSITPLSDKLKPAEVPRYETRLLARFKPQIFISDNNVLFYYPDYIYQYTNGNVKCRPIGATSKHGHGGFMIGKQIFVHTALPENSLCRWIGDKPIKIAAPADFVSQNIIFETAFDEKQTLVGTVDSLDKYRVYLTDGTNFKPYVQDAVDKLASLNDGPFQAYVYHEKIVLVSRLSGCLIVKKNSGEIEQILNVSFGLPESKILAAFLDVNGRLWLAHEEKFSWTYLGTPISIFENGLSGNVNAIARSDRLYVATDVGVYYFANKGETVHIDGSVIMSLLSQRKAGPTMGKVPAPVLTQAAAIRQIPPDAAKKGFFDGILGRNKKKDKKEKETAQQTALEANRRAEEERMREAERLATEEQERRLKKLQQDILAAQAAAASAAKQTDFMRVSNLPEERYTAMAILNGRLYAGSVDGLYEIENGVGRKVSEEPTGRLLVSNKIPHCIFTLPPDESEAFGAYICENGACVYRQIEEARPYNGTMAETTDGTVWVGTENGAVSLKFNGHFTEKPAMKAYLPDTKSSDKNVRVFNLGQNVLATQGDELFIWENNSFVSKPQLKKYINPTRRTWSDGRNPVWLCNDRSLYSFGTGGSISDSIFSLNLFERLSAMYVDKDKNFWLGSSGKLIRLNAHDKIPAVKNFVCQLRSVRVNDEPVEDLTAFLSLPYSANYELRFRFIAPAYDGVRYQYKLHADAPWTDAETNRLNLPFTYGEYQFRVRAIDVFGNVSKEASFDFSVATPFWMRWYFWAGVLLLGVGGTFSVSRYRQKALEADNRRLNDLVDERTSELRSEKEKSDKYLKIILPEIIAEELKAKNRVEAVNHRNVCILFTDFKGFTQIAEKMTPENLVSELEICFEGFDHIITYYRLEKIKTIGDAYMAAGGIPLADPGNPIKIILAALEFARITAEIAAERKKQGLAHWEIRIGLHYGSVVAGLIGKQRFTYDIWGDAVNTASRMESSGIPGQVNISGDMYRQIKNYFKCSFRGKIEAKNKGEIEMYLVDGILPELSEGGAGLRPNVAFWDKLKQEFPGTLLPQGV